MDKPKVRSMWFNDVAWSELVEYSSGRAYLKIHENERRYVVIPLNIGIARHLNGYLRDFILATQKEVDNAIEEMRSI